MPGISPGSTPPMSRPSRGRPPTGGVSPGSQRWTREQVEEFRQQGKAMRARGRELPQAPYNEPDPYRFELLRAMEGRNGYTLARIKYVGCSNYEGHKILLLKKTLAELDAMRELDPHFLEQHDNGLVARFVPTEEGWKLGIRMLATL